jgi:hypothetical protein
MKPAPTTSPGRRRLVGMRGRASPRRARAVEPRTAHAWRWRPRRGGAIAARNLLKTGAECAMVEEGDRSSATGPIGGR